MTDLHKTPRLHVDQPLQNGGSVTAEGNAHHYLKNVMRIEAGDTLRLFNGKDGEWRGRVEDAGKKAVRIALEEQLQPQGDKPRSLHLLFTPLKKERLDWLVEKAVELGATDLHPVLTQNTDIRKLNDERMALQIIEAAEQCERLDIPALHPAADLFRVLSGWPSGIPVYAGLERMDAPPLAADTGPCALLIGPPGGFTVDEKEKLASLPVIRPVSLGSLILRAETAALAGLARLNAAG